MTDDRKRLTASEERLVALADERAFKVSKKPTLYYVEFEHAAQGQAVYLDRRKDKAIAICVSPESDLGRLADIPGLAVPSGFLHGAGMTRFPKRLHTGKKQITYGYQILCTDITAYCRLLERLADIWSISSAMRPKDGFM